jgi:hypothetical protein
MTQPAQACSNVQSRLQCDTGTDNAIANCIPFYCKAK